MLSDSPWAQRMNLREHITDTYRGGDSGASMGNPRETQEIKLEFFVPGTNHKLYMVWKVKDLTWNGAPSF